MLALLRDIFLKDFWLKLFSLALAALIWITVSLAIQKEVTPVADLPFKKGSRTFFNLPISVLSPGEDVRKFKVEPNDVEVTVEGEAKLLEGLQRGDIRVIVVLSGNESGPELQRPIEVTTPTGVTHVRVEPQLVKVVAPPKG